MKNKTLTLAAICFYMAEPSWSDDWTATSNSISVPIGTNVGIGTSTPGYPLDVRGVSVLGGKTIVTGSTPGEEAFVVKQSMTTGAIAHFRNPSATMVIIDNAGQVGIGTTTPTSLLDVVGGAVSQSVNSNSVYMNGSFRNTSTGNTALSILELGESATGSLRSQYYGSGFTSVGYNVASSGMLTTGSAATGGMTMLVQANAPFRVYTNSAERYTISGEGVHSLTGPVSLSSTLGTTGLITATGGILLNGGADGPGRITKHATHGIIHQGVTGTLNDWVLLNQAGHYLINNPTGTESLEFQGSGTNAFTGLVTASGGILLNGGADGPGRITKHATHGIIHQGVTGTLNDWVLFNQAGHYLINNPTGTESLEFKGAGSNAFTGVVTMSNTLGVTGATTLNGGLTAQSTTGNQRVQLLATTVGAFSDINIGRSTSGTERVTLGFDATGGAAYFNTAGGVAPLNLQESGGATTVGGAFSQSFSSNSSYLNGAFRNTSTGSAAITMLDVGQSATASIRTQYYGSGFATTGFNVASSGMLTTGSAATGGMTMLVQANAPFRVYTNGTERYTISGEGVHAITGPATVSSTLDVTGEGTVANLQIGSTDGQILPGGYIGFNRSPNIPAQDYALYQLANGYTTVNASPGTEVNLAVGGTDIVSVKTDLVTVDAKLKVTGILEVGTVVATNWQITPPDYVFEKNYNLTSLEKVESFVKKNKHLPEVPSAKEMKKEGVDLVKMNFDLLKKVEELTLYAIEQNKEIASLKKSVSKLERGTR